MNQQTKQLMKANKQLETHASDKVKDVLTEIVVYLRTANISEYNQEVVRHDITLMLIEGEKRGAEIESIIGNDYQYFCDQVLAEIPERTTKEKWRQHISEMTLYTSILLFIWLIKKTISAITNTLPFPSLAFSLADLISGIIIISMAIHIVYYLSHHAFLTNKNNAKLFFLVWLILFVCIIISSSNSILMNTILFHINAYVALVVVIILFALSKYCERNS